jgi:hypothetical protein
MTIRVAKSPPRVAPPPKFLKVHQYANEIYDINVVHRDNSSFLSVLHDNNAAIFLRPMQLGKHLSLLWLSSYLEYDWLESTDPKIQKNASYVLRIDFGRVEVVDYNTDWVAECASYDESVREIVLCAVECLIREHDLGELTNETGAPLMAGALVRKLVAKIRTKKGKHSKLLVLVDEYDKPVREVLLDLMITQGLSFSDLQKKLKQKYRNYIGFFDSCKSAYAEIDLKVWVTGITPIGLYSLSSFKPEDFTFQSSMADAVGLLDADITRMMDAVDNYKPFATGDKARIIDAIKMHFNTINYDSGSDLYHTGMVNKVMGNVLLDDRARQKCSQISNKSLLS